MHITRAKKKLDVLLISGSYSPQRGGVASHVEWLAKALGQLQSKGDKRRICNVHVLTGTPHKEIRGEKYPKVHRVIPPEDGHSAPFSSASNVPLIGPIQYALTKWDGIMPDIIHAHDFESIQIGLMLKIAHKIPLIATIHKTPKEHDVTLMEREPKECYLAFMQMHDFVDHLVAPSSAYGTRLASQGFSEEKITLIHHGIPVRSLAGLKNKLSVFNRFNLEEKSNFFFCPTRLDAHKGLETLISAAEILAHSNDVSSCRYVIAGSGIKKYKDELIQKLAEKNLLSLFRLGPDDGGDCDEREMATLYRHAKACILPSKREGFGLSLLESFVFRAPVIASNTGGIPDVIDPRINGYLFNRDEPEDLAKQIKRLIANPQRTQAFVRKALERVENEFSAEIMAQKYFDLYQEIAGIKVA